MRAAGPSRTRGLVSLRLKHLQQIYELFADSDIVVAARKTGPKEAPSRFGVEISSRDHMMSHVVVPARLYKVRSISRSTSSFLKIFIAPFFNGNILAGGTP